MGRPMARMREKYSGTSAGSICSTIGNKTRASTSILEYAPSLSERVVPLHRGLKRLIRGRGVACFQAQCEKKIAVRLVHVLLRLIREPPSTGRINRCHLPGNGRRKPAPSRQRGHQAHHVFRLGGVIRRQVKGDVGKDSGGLKFRCRETRGDRQGRWQIDSANLAARAAARVALASELFARRRASLKSVFAFSFSPSSNNRSATSLKTSTRTPGAVAALASISSDQARQSCGSAGPGRVVRRKPRSEPWRGPRDRQSLRQGLRPAGSPCNSSWATCRFLDHPSFSDQRLRSPPPLLDPHRIGRRQRSKTRTWASEFCCSTAASQHGGKSRRARPRDSSSGMGSASILIG